jgi:hypothetical protein
MESYWQISRLIVEQEQHGETSTVYAKELIERLSEDLTNQLGSGFSERNLYKMRKFYLAHKVLPTSANLNWSHHVELLAITNKADKRQLERRIISDNLSPRQITAFFKMLAPRPLSPGRAISNTILHPLHTPKSHQLLLHCQVCLRDTIYYLRLDKKVY